MERRAAKSSLDPAEHRKERSPGRGQSGPESVFTPGPSGGDSDRQLDGAWSDFLEPPSHAAFLSGWLKVTSARIDGTEAAILFVRADANRLGVGAVWNVDEEAREGFEAVADDVASQATPLVRPYREGVILGYPISIGNAVQAVVAIGLKQHPGRRLRRLFREIHWSAGWIEAQLWQGRSRVAAKQTEAAKLTLALLGAADAHERFDAAAMALVNAIRELTGFDRASVGMLRGNKVNVEALSRVAAFKSRADWVGLIAVAMDEAVAQGRPIAIPKLSESATPVDLGHRALSDSIGGGAVLTVPLQVRGSDVGAVTVMRARSETEVVRIDPDAVEELRLAAASVAPVLFLKYQERRWISGRLRSLATRALTAVLGRRPALALAAAAVAVALVLPFVMTAEFRISADAVLQGAEQRAAVALIDGYITESGVRAGDAVKEGDLLARLDDRDLELERSRLTANVVRAEQAMRNALAAGDRTASAKASADLAEAGAALKLVEQRLDRLDVRAPISGVVVSGDLSQRLGGSATRGEVLFEVARTDKFRLLIDVSEYDVAKIAVGQTGDVVFPGLVGRDIPFVVTGIASVSKAAEGENRFRIEADVTKAKAELRPGLEGVAKVLVGRESLAWLWLRGTVDRIRIWFWRFAP